MKRTNRSNGYEISWPNPQTATRRRSERKGLRVHVESSHPARHKRNWPLQRYKRPCLPFFVKQGHRVRAI